MAAKDKNPREFHLSYNNGAESIIFPVNPPSVSFRSGMLYSDYEVEGLGEVTVIGHEALDEFSFSSFFPVFFDPGFCNFVPDRPFNYVKTINRWKSTGKPLRLIITGTPINYAVTIRDFSCREEGIGDIYFDISFKEFVFTQIKRIDKSKKRVQAKSNQRPDTRVRPKTYTVKKGDNLWTIGKRNNVSHTKLASLNGIKSPYTIRPGQVIKLS